MTQKLGRSPERTAKIRALNDAFRQTGRGGDVIISDGVAHMPLEEQIIALKKISLKADFDDTHNPEHNPGSVQVGEQAVVFKIDYYHRECRLASPDPANPDVTTRVMTIMLAREY